MQLRPQTRIFTASEVADFEYCSLAWWHEQYEDWAQAESDELFARLVELELEHGTQAPALPEYQLIEQLLLRQGAFEREFQQHQEYTKAVEESEEEIAEDPRPTASFALRRRALTIALLALGGLAFLLLVSAVFVH